MSNTNSKNIISNTLSKITNYFTNFKINKLSNKIDTPKVTEKDVNQQSVKNNSDWQDVINYWKTMYTTPQTVPQNNIIKVNKNDGKGGESDINKQKYAENTTYAPAINVAYQLGNSLRKRNRSAKKEVDTSKYQGLTNQVKSIAGLGTVTTPYGGSTRYESFHPGVDIANNIGTKIPAFVSGVVSEVTKGQQKNSPGFGNYVVITDSQGNKHRYSHLHEAYVSVGQEINPGQPLGDMGNTGQTYSLTGGTGSHLDYRVKNAYGKYVNPLIFINNSG